MTKKPKEPAVVSPLSGPIDPHFLMILRQLEMFRRGGRDAEIALASGVAGLGRRPGDKLN
jgi:hypothetical protein